MILLGLAARLVQYSQIFTKVKSHKILFSRADSSLVDKPGNTPVHGGLTGFGKVRRLTMIWNNNQRHSSLPVIYPFKWLWTLGCPPKAKLISVTYPLKSSCLCILGNQKNQIFISKIDQLQHMVKIWEFYKVKLAKDKPKICNFQNLVITFDWGVLLT